jgi:hypothetical protein
MEQKTLYILYSTFFMWFLSWTLIESVMNYYKVQPLSKIKIVLIALSIAVVNYIYMTDTKDDNE